MLEYTSNFITANGVKLHYYRTGGNKPPLVLAHGITDDGLCWLRLAEEFAQDYDVIMVDARGHGKSEAPSTGYALQDLVIDLAELVQGLKLNKPILMGHSMGAITVLMLAGFYPDLPGVILLEDPPPFWMPVTQVENNTQTTNPLQEWIVSLKRQTYAELMAAARSNSTWPEIEFEPWVNSKHRMSPLVANMPLVNGSVSVDFVEVMSKVICPALLLTADQKRGAISGEKDVDQLQEWIKQLKTEHIEGAGHNIRREQYEAVVGAVRKFLANLLIGS